MRGRWQGRALVLAIATLFVSCGTAPGDFLQCGPRPSGVAVCPAGLSFPDSCEYTGTCAVCRGGRWSVTAWDCWTVDFDGGFSCGRLPAGAVECPAGLSFDERCEYPADCATCESGTWRRSSETCGWPDGGAPIDGAPADAG